MDGSRRWNGGEVGQEKEGVRWIFTTIIFKLLGAARTAAKVIITAGRRWLVLLTGLAKKFMTMESKRLADLYTEVSNKIMVFATDKNIQRAFSASNIILPQDLEENCSIYLNIPEDKLDQWSVPVNLIVRKFLKHFERRPDEQAAPILFVLDEFPRLGKVEGIAAALSTLRSKKITIALVLQSPAQLDMIYGHAAARVIMDNCVYKAILGACDAESQETFSLLMGTQSVEQQGMSTNYAPGSEEERGRTVSSHAVDRRIIQPHHYATLKDVVLLTPFGNFRAGKIRPVVG